MSTPQRRIPVILAALGPVALAAVLAASAVRTTNAPAESKGALLSAAARTRLAALSLPFVPNRGQVDPHVAYYAQTFAGTAYVTRAGTLVLALPPRPAAKAPHRAASRAAPVLVETPVTSRALTAQGIRRAQVRVSVIQGGAHSRWKFGLPTYASVSLGEPWPGVSYSVVAHGTGVERIFKLEPGARASAIQMRIRGASKLALAHGCLVAETLAGPVTLSKPRAFQLRGKSEAPVSVRYTIQGMSYGLRLGKYDPSHAVVIDPLIRATYLGGNALDGVSGAVIDPNNDALYVTGSTQSADFPGTSGGAQPRYAGSTDAFIAKMSLDLKTLDAATYLGGSNADSGVAIAVAPASSPEAGDIYVTGDTRSTDFPGTAGGAQPNCAGTAQNCADTGDGYVALLSPTLTTLLQASYLGGTNIDDMHSIAVGHTGTVYLAGRTLSSDFPATAGGAQPIPGGSDYSGFVAALAPDLTSFLQATYLGGSSVNEAYGLALDPANGDVYVTGDTSSNDFPCAGAGGPPPPGGGICGSTTAGAQASYAGSFDAFVSILNPALTSIVQSTYLGGTGADQATALAFGSSGNIYVAGETSSVDMPGLSGAAQPLYAGGNDAFVSELSADLTSLTRTTYLGGSLNDLANAIVVSPANGDIYVAGNTQSGDFPCTAPSGPNPVGGTCPNLHAGAIPTLGGTLDAFVALVSPDLKQLLQATYFGGSANDEGNSLLLAPAPATATGDVYVAGLTSSSALPGTAGAAQPAYAGSIDGYAAMMTPDLQGPQINLAVEIGAPANAQRGTVYSYKVTVTNATAPTTAFDGTATGVILNNIIPVQTVYKSATSSQGEACTQLGSVVTCNLGSITGNGGSASVTIKVKPTASGSAGDVATVTANQAFTTDSTLKATAITSIPFPNSNSGGASLVGVWTILGLAGLALVALFGPGRRY